MTGALLLSRARLRRDAPIGALAQVLAPPGTSVRAERTHRLVWTLFADDPGRRRDFLWRESEPGCFYLLSRRPPEDRHGLFHLDPPKDFAPVLTPGDRLDFVLRANATVAKPAGRDTRGRRADVVMDSLRALPPGGRGPARAEAIQAAGAAWLVRQGVKAGFDVESVVVDRYEALSMERSGPPMRIGVLDLRGSLRVTDPGVFLASVADGFGRAKAFGCGLMLLRRA
jgi:CRISPR system Cascade subunit CasE